MKKEQGGAKFFLVNEKKADGMKTANYRKLPQT